MRVNVYAEEIRDEIKVIRKPEHGPEGRVFLGIRLYLESSTKLHHTEKDDDRSAITIWVPWTKEKGNDKTKLAIILRKMAYEIEQAKEF